MGDSANSVNSDADYDTVESNETVEDLSIIPLQKDSFALCEGCGYIDVRDKFYARNKNFCSLRCYKSTINSHRNWRFTVMGSTDHMAGMIPLEQFPQLEPWSATLTDLQAGPIKETASAIANSYEWKDELFGCDFLAAPVSLFKHAPLCDMWDNTFEGMKVEVKNNDYEDYSDKLSDFFWVATVIKVKGYMGLLRYEGFGSDDSKDFWVNLCCSEVHPVGWCATRGKPLIPPRSIEDKYSDWKKYLVKQLTGARTLPANFYSKLADNLKSRFSVGTIVEVVDKNRISQVKVASVYEMVGKRLHIKYYDSSPEDNGFWCHEDSPLIHPVGWAFKVGHNLDAPPFYCDRVATGRLLPNDATADMVYKFPTSEPPLFSEGMKIEAIDPLNLSAICAATVMQILLDGYMMIRIDCYPAEESGADWFCYHQLSPCIFPVGFSLANNITLVPPNGWAPEEFTWEQYLSRAGTAPAPAQAFRARTGVVAHGFVAGMRLECADLMDPRLVCVATVARVVHDLLKIHFDGWGEEYDQWLYVHSTDVYPVGWARAVRHRLEGPPPPPPPPPPPRARPKPAKPARRAKLKARRQPRRPAAQQRNNPPVLTEDSSQNSDITDLKSVSSAASETSTETTDTKPTDDKKDSPQMDADSDISMDKSTTLPIDIPVTEPDEPMTETVEQNQEENSTMETLPNIQTKEIHPIEEPVEPPQEVNEKLIPRLVNNATVPYDKILSVDPINWTTCDVAKFLTVNDCQPYCINFASITGPMMLQLSKDEIIELLEMKVGPSLKIYDLIQTLKCKIRQPPRLPSLFK